jgi:6-pyruvoyltetrahydropterin/6-carboxytetrahydropterin synthase
MHRVPRHEGKCRAYHGHRYVAEIHCAAGELDSAGRVVDFGVIKELVGGWIDSHWDHTAILMRGDTDPACQAVATSNAAFGRPVYWLDEAPTAENLVAELARISGRLLESSGVKVVRIRLWETPNCAAEWVVPQFSASEAVDSGSAEAR